MIMKETKGNSSSMDMHKNDVLRNNVHCGIQGNKIIHHLFFAFYAFIFIPTSYFIPINFGLDPSWQYAVNFIANTNWKFGSDAVTTNGPLGFLSYAENIGQNQMIATVCNIAIYLVVLFLLIRFFYFEKKFSARNVEIGIGAIFFIVGFTTRMLDYYVVLGVMLALSLSWFTDNIKSKYIYFLTACFLTIFVAFMKFSGATMALSAVILFCLSDAILKRKIDKSLLLLTLVIPLGFTISYLIYNPSFTGLFNYIKGALDITAGNSAALSGPLLENWELVLVGIFIGVAYVILITINYFINKRMSAYMLIFSGVFFFIFKHAFVRPDWGHMTFFFNGLLMFLPVLLLFINTREIYDWACRKNTLMITLCGIISMLILPSIFYTNLSPRYIAQLINWQYIELATDVRQNVPAMVINPDGSQIPSGILEIIGNDTMTIIPWDVSYNAYNDINYVPYHTLQTHMAYTPYLDKMNAGFFQDSNAAKYILFEFKTIDGRLPVLDMPQTWEAIYCHYNLEYTDNNFFLLKKMDDVFTPQSEQLSEATYGKYEGIDVPESDNIVTMRLKIKLSLWGKIVNFFLKTPPVMMKLTMQDGQTFEGRVITDVLSEDVIINKYTNDFLPLANTLNSHDVSNGVSSFRLYGEGVKYYQDKIEVVFNEYQNKKDIQDACLPQLSTSQAVDLDLSTLIRTEDKYEFAFDRINDRSGDTYETHIYTNSTLTIEGWAGDELAHAAASAVYISLGDNLYPTLKLKRPDVAEYYGTEAYLESGYKSEIFEADLPSGRTEIKFIIISNDGKSYYSASTDKFIVVE